MCEGHSPNRLGPARLPLSECQRIKGRSRGPLADRSSKDSSCVDRRVYKFGGIWRGPGGGQRCRRTLAISLSRNPCSPPGKKKVSAPGGLRREVARDEKGNGKGYTSTWVPERTGDGQHPSNSIDELYPARQ